MSAEPLDQILERLQSQYKWQPLPDPTPEELAQREADERREAEYARQAKAARLFEAGNIPPRHRDKADIKRDGPWGQALAKLLAKLHTGAETALIGKWGPGKTQLAVEVMREGAQRHYTVRYATATEFVSFEANRFVG